MKYVALLAALALTGCTWSRVTVTTVVVKTDVKKDGSPTIKGSSDIDIVPQILKALPDAEEALEEYKDKNGAGSDN